MSETSVPANLQQPHTPSSALRKNANSSMRYSQLPLNRVIELGTQVEI
jgi:K+ transporter